MDLERFCVKFFVQSEVSVDQQAFIPIFHEWIRDKKLPGTLIDVADYRHVPQGPGVMLVTHEVNYAMDEGNGLLGLYAQRKQGNDSPLKESILDLVRRTATFGALLESDARVDGLKLAGGKFYYMANDRLHAPNTEATFTALKPVLEAAAAELYPGKSVQVSWLKNDPRDRLTAVVEVSEPVAIAALAA